MKFIVPEPPKSVSQYLPTRHIEQKMEPIKQVRKAKLSALDVLSTNTKRRARRAENNKLIENFLEGLKLFYPQDYEEIMKEKQERLAKKKRL